jgi:chromosome segregation ATPase
MTKKRPPPDYVVRGAGSAEELEDLLHELADDRDEAKGLLRAAEEQRALWQTTAEQLDLRVKAAEARLAQVEAELDAARQQVLEQTQALEEIDLRTKRLEPKLTSLVDTLRQRAEAAEASLVQVQQALQELPVFEAEFHSGDREPGTMIQCVSWEALRAALAAAPGTTKEE